MPGVLTVQEHIALVEIELCGELMIAASAAIGDRLSPDRIDEVLMVGSDTSVACRGHGRRAGTGWGTSAGWSTGSC
ncbi:hypothetical protein OG204_20550 [Streptomyces sp. NBC_01387]|uniref:hypothetical protein n=1 Tax=unclassified Streptomyces TaxID=2593676 RepID=UPI002024CA81|nr:MULTISPECIES: hypothetical protein [unclassified Streptomyces]MCX4549295.1 hypothetical protein [Streptomyces sp. NBC_01500]WSC20839.1 hypothetical protein OIE60_14710 [Streptomyces sp. NBC_01766]WSV54866.1 hypothetical protein OG282_14755 [Streptomyces sp. NBC_01014]